MVWLEEQREYADNVCAKKKDKWEGAMLFCNKLKEPT